MSESPPSGQSEQGQYQASVAAYVAAGGDESVQRVINAAYSLTRKLDRWYARQLADIDISHGDWSVFAHIAKAGDTPVTPTRLADATNVAPSSMTHRLDKMVERGWVRRDPDPNNRTRILISLTDEGWRLFELVVKDANVVESDTLAGLSRAERGELARLLEVVIAGLDELEIP